MITTHIYNADGTINDSPDLDAGKIVTEEVSVTIRYLITQEEQGHYEVVAEYPETGGKDVAWVVDAGEVGYWQATSDGEPIELDMDTSGFDRSMVIEGTALKRVYVPYSEEELEAIQLEKKQEEDAAQFAIEAPAKIAALEQRIVNMQIEQDVAICELYEMMIGEEDGA